MTHQTAGRPSQRGAALLLAMMIVALVATLTAGMVWQQWRAIQVESAERSRTQSLWMLTAALDWSRLLLREDGRGSRGVDHLGEPWAQQLVEARLSTFLAADQNNNTEDGPEAFLSGSMSDAQARYNLRNLMAEDGKPVAAEIALLGRLCENVGLPGDLAGRIAQSVIASWRPTNADDAAHPLPVQHFDHLAWAGLDARTMAALRPVVDVLPKRTPVNVNTASREVLAAVLSTDAGTAARLIQTRQRKYFDSLATVGAQLALPPGTELDPNRVSVATIYFIVNGRLRLEQRVIEQQSLVERSPDNEVVAVQSKTRSQHLDTP
jgi:general secretion pathway protein K